MKKLICCQIRLFMFEEAFENLRTLEEYLTSDADRPNTKVAQEDLDMTLELLGNVNYQIFKFPSLGEYASRTVGCGCDDDRMIDVDDWFPRKPSNGSKMSGHRMTYA